MSAQPEVIRVAIVDDHLMVRDSLAELLTRAAEVEVVWSGDSVGLLQSHLRDTSETVEVILLDVRLDCAKVTPRQVMELTETGTQVILLTAYPNDPYVVGLIRNGAAGVVAKRQSTEELVAAIQQSLAYGSLTNADTLASLASTSADGIGLTQQERNVLLLYASGMKIDAVAHQLGISPHTVKDYLRRLRRKLQDAGMPAPSQVSLYQRAQELGLVD